MTAVRSLLDWCSNTTTIVFIRDSQYGMPIVQSVHLVGLTLLLATVLVLNLRLAGVALKDSSLPAVEQQLRPWMIGGLPRAGVRRPHFRRHAGKYLASLLSSEDGVPGPGDAVPVRSAPAVLRSAPGVRRRSLNIVVAALSLTLWFTVGWAGRAIAFI